jgi:uncharacterized membrane protein
VLRHFFKTARTNILIGLIVALPVAVTIWIIDLCFRLATNWMPRAAFPRLYGIWNGYLLRLLTLLVVLGTLYAIGLVARNLFGRRFISLGDKVLERIPVVKKVYIAVRQISDSLLARRHTIFKEVVAIEYPRAGLYAIAFVMADTPGTIRQAIRNAPDTPEDLVSLFVPTTPNPTSGVLILAPRSSLRRLDISVSDALAFVVSGGAATHGGAGPVRPTLLDKIEGWLRHDGDGPEASS